MSRMLTVEVLGVDLVVEFDGTPFVPAQVSGPPESCYPCEGGEADVVGIYLDGTEVTSLLNDYVINQVNEKVVEFLCSPQEEESEEPERELV